MTAHASSVTYRWMALAMVAVAVLGWGLFFLNATSSASVEEGQRLRIGRLQEERDRLDAELKEQRAKSADLAALEAKVAAARDSLARTTAAADSARARAEEARTALASTQTALATQRAQLASAETASDSAQVDRTGTIERAKPRRKRWYRRRRR